MTDGERLIGKELKKLINRIGRNTEADGRCHDKGDISNTNRWLIMYLYDNSDRDIFQKDIEDEFSIRRSTSSNIISLMEKKGYIERIAVDYDARLKKLVLTQKSLELADEMTKRTLEFEKHITKGISAEELRVFYKVLDKMNNNLD